LLICWCDSTSPEDLGFAEFEMHTKSVFSPGCGLAGFPEEKLTWGIKSQEDAPVWAQRQATCQTDFRVGTLEWF